jgi:peptidyl-tRNA hydrolase
MKVVQYIIVRGDLIDKFGVGVLATQVSHASIAPITNQLRRNFNKPVYDALDNPTKSWVDGSFTKIVLEVPGKDELLDLIGKLYADGIEFSRIEESSLGNELTCIGLNPYEKNKVSQYFQGLYLLGHRKAEKKQ